MALLNRSDSNTRAMRAIAAAAREAHARRQGPATTPSPSTSRPTSGGHDLGPEPAGAAGRLARVVHGGHDGDVRRSARAGTPAASRSTADYTPAERGCPTRFELVLQAAGAPRRGADRAAAGDRGEVPGPPHARGRGRLRRAGRARLSTAAELAAGAPRRRDEARGDRRARRQATPPCSCPLFERPGGALHAVFTAPPPRPAPPSPARSRSRAAGATTDEDAARHGAARGARGGRPAAWRRRAARRAAADADVRHQLRDLSVRRADRARLRVGAAGHRGRRGARARARRPPRRLRRAPAGAARASRSAPRRYEAGGHLIWGATARIFGDLIGRSTQPPGEPGLWGWLGSRRSYPFSIGTLTMLPHSVHEPS